MTCEQVDVEALLRRAEAAGVDPLEAARAFLNRELRAHGELFAMDPQGREFIAPGNVARLRDTARRTTASRGRSVDLLDVVREIEARCQKRFVAEGVDDARN